MTHGCLACFGALVAACAGTTQEPDAPTSPSEQVAVVADPPAAEAHANATPHAEPVVADGPWRPLVREVAASYASWGMVDSQFHWAPGLCAMPARGVQHLSAAKAGTAHGEKVFVLHALDPMAYWKATDVKGRLPETLAHAGAGIQSRGDVVQVLVKESFVPRPLEGRFQGGIVPARKGEETFGAGDPIGLFVMAQLRGAPEGTDEGWIYATVAPDGEITGAGDLDTCRGCHAQHADRVFGMPLQWK